MILQRNCHEFIAYENLSGVRKAAIKTGRPMPAAAASSPIAQAQPVVRRALKILADREVTPQTGLLKSTLLQLDSTFSERNYGASSFLDFVEKLAQTGFVHLRTSGRSVMVELNEAFSGEETPAAPRAAESAAPAPLTLQPAPSRPVSDVAQMFRAAEEQAAQYGDDTPPASTDVRPTEVRATESAEAGVQRAGQILGAATAARWPMYLRNVKQILRQADGGFDERRYGFSGLMDLLKACQREGFVRIERDRRGGLRVFQGAALARSAAATIAPREILDVEPIETPSGDAIDASESADTERAAMEPIPIDTTAELLGRAKPRKPRARAARPAPVTVRKAAAKKPPARRSTRSRKTATSKVNDEIES
jgi:OST-HTH/LOTUS domain